MNFTIIGHSSSWNVVAFAAIGWLLSAPSPALAQPHAEAEGVVHHYTAELDPGGPWQIVGDWKATLNTASGRVDFFAALSMARSDNPSRAAHTHHISLTGGQVTTLANGYRISGAATMTSNGALAGFSGSSIDVEITGGSGVTLSNLKVFFGGASAAHFGAEPVLGVVSASR